MVQKDTTDQDLRFAVLATDIAVFTIKDEELYIRTVNVNRPPHFVNIPGLPGGLIQPQETAEEAVERIIKDKGGISTPQLYIEQLYTFSEVDRDPRGRVVAVGYIGLVDWDSLTEKERSSSADAHWVSVAKLMDTKMAYDHNNILEVAVQRIRSRVTYTTLISKIIPKEFTLTELKQAYEAILHQPLDKRNFRKKLLKTDVLRELDKERSGEPWRPAKLYSFKDKKIREISMI